MLFKLYKTFGHAIWGTGIFLAAIFCLTYLALQEIEGQVREDVGNALEIVVKSTQEAQLIWIKNHKKYLRQLSKDPALISLVYRHNEVSRTPQALLNSQSLKELREFFDTKRDKFEDIGFFIITSDNINIASMRDANVGLTNLIAEERPDFLKRAFDGETVFVLPIRSDVPLESQSAKKAATMFFAAPIKSEGKVLAVLTLRFVPGHDFTRITQIGRIGNSGETYAFDQTGLLISNSRFNDQLRQIGLIKDAEEGILNVRITDPGGNLLEGYQSSRTQIRQPLTLMAKSAVSGIDGVNIEGYRDYRGVTVLGAWLWMADLGYGLTTEIDEKEALESFYTTKMIVLGLIAVTLFLSLVLVFIIFWLEQRARKAEKNMKVLSGMLPICANCKKIRNDKGYWSQIESYIREHSEADFSHSMCPECVKKLYPEFHDEITEP